MILWLTLAEFSEFAGSNWTAGGHLSRSSGKLKVWFRLDQVGAFEVNLIVVPLAVLRSVSRSTPHAPQPQTGSLSRVLGWSSVE